MEFLEFEELVSNTMSSHPVWFGLESDKIAEDSDIQAAERALGVELPDEYNDFVRKYGGGYFAFSIVYSLQEGSDWNLVALNKKYNEIRNDYLLFSDNGAGDFYGFRIVNGVCDSQIYFYDHETNCWSRSPFDNLFDYLKNKALTN